MENRKIRLSDCRGFTIIEGLIAILIISLATVPCYKAIVTAHKFSVKLADDTAIYFAVSSEMEILKSGSAAIGYGSRDIIINKKDYRLKWTIKERFPYGGIYGQTNNIREITVAIYKSKKELFKLVSLYSK